jgi:hypothetical protein
MRSRVTELRRLRRYVDHEGDQRRQLSQDPSDDGLRAFLGGFFTGDGSFGLNGKAVACVHLRADDAPLLRRIRDAFDLGSVHLYAPRGQNPTARWHVGRRAELPRAIELFESAVLRGRKRREFDAWRIGAAEYARGRDRDPAAIAEAAAALADARAYVERDVAWPTHATAAESYADVLRAFAAELPGGALTCTAYARARGEHPEWPTRNTITLAFGSWVEALRAAGLGSRASARSRARARE